MSTLTKVFVVLLVISSIAFTSMTVSITAQTANWREIAKRYEQHAQVADTNLRNLIAANSAELASAAETINTHLDTIAQQEATLETIRENELNPLRDELRQVKVSKAATEAMNSGLLAQLGNAESIRDEYRGQRDGLERQSVDLQRRNIDLNDRVNELTANMSVLVEQKRQYEQQLNVLRDENKRLARATRSPALGETMEAPTGAAMTNVSPASPVSVSPIRGRIVDVSGDVMTISVGAADGVEKEMLFVIHRNGEYVGDLRISMVDPSQAAGRLVSSRVAVQDGDLVTNASGLGGRRG